MIKKFINYMNYRKKVKLLKMIAVNQLTDFVINKAEYTVGIQKLLLMMAKSDDNVESQKLFDNYVDLLKKTKIANDVVDNDKIDKKVS